MKARKTRAPKGRRPTASIGATTDLRGRFVAEAAYFIAEHEGFPPGRALEHWLRAEAEFERQAAAPARRGAKSGPA